MSASATKEQEEDPIQAFILKWVVYPIFTAVAAIVAVGVAATLVSPDWQYPSWLHAVVGIPAMGAYYAVQLRVPLTIAFSWTRTKRANQDASTSGGGVATSIRGRKNVVQVTHGSSSPTWQLREEHRQDLVEQAIKPWIQEVDRLTYFVEPHLLGNYAHAALGFPGFTFRTATGLPTGFPHNSVLWQKAHEHWPHLASKWQDLQKELRRLDNQVLALLSELVSRLPSPPMGLEWQWHNGDDPRFGARWAATELWQRYWDVHEKTNARSKLEDDVRQARWWSSKQQPNAPEFASIASGFFFHADQSEQLEEFTRSADSMLSRLKNIKQDLTSVAYNRNLAGSCELCPEA